MTFAMIVEKLFTDDKGHKSMTYQWVGEREDLVAISHKIEHYIPLLPWELSKVREEDNYCLYKSCGDKI